MTTQSWWSGTIPDTVIRPPTGPATGTRSGVGVVPDQSFTVPLVIKRLQLLKFTYSRGVDLLNPVWKSGVGQNTSGVP